MAHAWNACWVNALGGSNPPSSADVLGRDTVYELIAAQDFFVSPRESALRSDGFLALTPNP